ncbi:MAG: DUF5702 domain-containing protein [Lacrimispora sp.]|uniref:DUF5702 domain-containing protein n=1 Tax=Lacrimispora sp. TaxID=2719234 RepID=UPI0039E3E12B
MRKSGQITVFFSMVLMCIFSLMCGLLESARTAGSRYYLKMAADSAMDSLFSQYHKEAWDQYRLFLLEGKDNAELEEAWKEFMEPYTESSGWYSMEIENAEALQVYRMTDQGGQYLKQDILDYMKYGIFENLTDETGAENLMTLLKEAGAVKNLSGAYSGHTKEAVRLERAFQDISDSLRKQKELWQEAASELSDYDGRGFRRKAAELEQEMNGIPSLVRAYGKMADQLKEKLKGTEAAMSQAREELSQEVRDTLREETACYESYVNEDGARRREIEALPEKMTRIKEIIDRAKERSVEVEEIISEWDDDDDEEDDGPDEEELWGSVEEIWQKIRIPALPYSNGVKDPEKQKLLEQVEGFVQSGLMNLVLPEGSEISKGVLDFTEFPSASLEEGQAEMDGLVDRILFQEYCDQFLTDFLSEEDKEVKYELEYLIAGKNTDEENLKKAVGDILMVREGMNLIHILSDRQKRDEAKALANVITGSVGLLPLAGVVAFFIMSVWALGESIIDVKMLLEGKKAAFVKTKETWNLSLTGLLELGSTGTCPGGDGDEKGMSYSGYLKLLLFIGNGETHRYRLMDVIQMNICRKQQGFRMAHCVYQAEIKGTANARHMFFGGRDPYYRMEVRTEKAY